MTANEEPRRQRSARTVFRALAECVKEVYITERNNWSLARGQPAGYRPSPKWDKVAVRPPGKRPRSFWEKIAEELVSRRIANYRQYVVVQFLCRKLRGNPPTPNQLIGAKAMRIWAEFSTNAPEVLDEIHLAFNSQRQTYSTEVYNELESAPYASDEKIVRGVLLNEQAELTALFRFCVAWRRGFESVVSRYADAAMIQYAICATEYDTVWKDWIPERFRDEARRLTQAVLDQEVY